MLTPAALWLPFTHEELTAPDAPFLKRNETTLLS